MASTERAAAISPAGVDGRRSSGSTTVRVATTIAVRTTLGVSQR